MKHHVNTRPECSSIDFWKLFPLSAHLSQSEACVSLLGVFPDGFLSSSNEASKQTSSGEADVATTRWDCGRNEVRLSQKARQAQGR